MKIIAGPCAIESVEHFVDTACVIQEAFDKEKSLPLELIIKGSFDKANRTYRSSPRGAGFPNGLYALEDVGRVTGLRTTTDIHEPWQVPEASRVVDILQIPAMLSRQTDLVCGAASAGKVVNLKVGTSMTSYETQGALDKLQGAKQRWATYRGTHYGPGTLVVDPSRLFYLKNSGFDKILLDITHTNEKQPFFSQILAKIGLSCGVDGFFMEVHPNPDKSPCDGPHMLDLNEFRAVLRILQGC